MGLHPSIRNKPCGDFLTEDKCSQNNMASELQKFHLQLRLTPQVLLSGQIERPLGQIC
jgi:hypothetical protein